MRETTRKWYRVRCGGRGWVLVGPARRALSEPGKPPAHARFGRPGRAAGGVRGSHGRRRTTRGEGVGGEAPGTGPQKERASAHRRRRSRFWRKVPCVRGKRRAD
eukprot:scaffold32645_cov144-Isochrysis_galbana.AAC.2